MGGRQQPARRLRADRAQATLGGSSGQPCAEWPLAGRDEDIAAAVRLLDGDDLSGLVVAGAPGTGKTRFLDEVIRRAETRGLVVERAVATRSAGTIPLGAVAHLVPSPHGSQATPFDRLRLALERFLERAGDTGLVLVVDDAQHLDDTTAALLHQLALAPKVLVVAAVDSQEPAPDALTALTKEQAAGRLELGPLTQDTVEQLLATVLGGPVERRTLLEIWSATGGSPLFLRALVDGGLEAGRLEESRGAWRWHGSFLVPKVVAAVRQRLDGLTQTEQEAAQVIAFANSASLPLASAIIDAQALRSLEQRGLIHLERDGRRRSIQFSLRLLAEVVRSDTPPLRAQQVCARLADLFDSLGTQRRDELVRAARWRLEAGSPVAADQLLAAVRHARRAGSARVAEGLARAAVDRGGSVPARKELAAVLADQGQCAEADDVLGVALEEAGDEEERCTLAELRAANLFWGLGRPAAAEQLLAETERSVEDADLRDRLRAARGLHAFLTGRPGDALAAVRPALRRADTGPHVVARSLVHVAPAQAVLGQTDEAIASLEQAASVGSTEDGTLGLTGDLRVERSFVLSIAGELEAAERLAREGYDHALGTADPERQALTGMTVGRALLGQGRAVAAATWLHEAADLLRDLQGPGLASDFLPWCLADLARARALTGDQAGALRTLTEARERLRPTTRIVEPAVARADGWIHVAAGRAEQAREAFLDAAEVGLEVGQTAIAAACLYEAGIVGEAAEVVSRLEGISDRFDGRLVSGYAAHLRAATEGDAAGLTAAAEQLEEAGALFAAGVAWADAAAAHAQEKSRRRSTWARSQSTRLMAECGVRRLPALRALETVPLTPREQEVVALAARELSSREIARRLVVSVRTVENHLYQAYGKLGVSGRTELARLFGEAGSPNVT